MNTLIRVTDQLIDLLRKAYPRPGQPRLDAQGVLLGIQAKNLSVLVALRRLAPHRGSGSPAMILSRTILEAEIGLEYMRARGFDVQLDRFTRFIYASAKEDVEYIRQGDGTDVPDEFWRFANFVDDAVEKFRQDLVHWSRRPKSEKGADEASVEPVSVEDLAHSWSQMDFDKMLESLVGQQGVTQDTVRTAKQMYIMGNRHVHLSPAAILDYMLPPDLFKERDAWQRETALRHGVTGLAVMATTIADHLGNQELVERIEETLKPLM